MNRALPSILSAKAQGRTDLRNLPFGEKLALLEKLKERRDAVARSPLRLAGAASHKRGPWR